jgi:hypothetical protein
VPAPPVAAAPVAAAPPVGSPVAVDLPPDALPGVGGPPALDALRLAALIDRLASGDRFGAGGLDLPAAFGASPAVAPGAQPAALDGGASLPQVPEPASPAGGAAASGAGAAFAFFLALLLSLAAFGLRHTSRLRLPPVQWRQFEFVAVVERPG